MVRVVVGVVMMLVGVAPALAQVYPPAPQNPNGLNLDAVEAGTTAGQVLGNVYVPFGNTGFIDPQAWGYCRYVSNTAVASGNRTGAIVHTHTAAEWLSFRSNPGTALSQVVCCRPQTVTLCSGAAGGAVSETLPYTVFGGQQTPVASCTDQWGAAFTDSQTWTCGETTTGVAADGQWSKVGGDRYACTANAYTSACSASCGGGTTTTYDSCGNVQSRNACNTQSCCSNNWQVSYGSCSGACGGGGGTQTVFMTNYGTCGGSYSYQQACTNTNACHYWTQTWHVWPGTCSDEAAWQGPCPYGSFINSLGQCESSSAGGCGYPPPNTYNGLVGSQCTSPGADGGTAVWNQVYPPGGSACQCSNGGSYFATGTNCE